LIAFFVRRIRMKDGLQEVPKGKLCPKLKDISALRQCKKAIKYNPKPDPWDHWFPGPPAFSTMQSFSSLLYK
jgi:hypothetical protein